MKIRVEMELDIDYDKTPNEETDYVKIVQDAPSWGNCEILRAEYIKEDNE